MGSSFQTRLLAGCVCFLTPQSVDSWYMYQHIHTHTNIRKPFCFFCRTAYLILRRVTSIDSIILRPRRLRPLSDFLYSVPAFKPSYHQLPKFSVFITIPLATIIIKRFLTDLYCL